MKRIDLTGHRFGRLVAISEAEERRHGSIAWHCICDCGNEVCVVGPSLRSGASTSCGCYKTETITGDQNHNWKGGITPDNTKVRNSTAFLKWRLDVFKRDSFTCQKCQQVGGQLNAHHILSFARFPEARLLIDNGITLCEKCHQDFHYTYGRLQFTEDNFWEWIQL